MIQPDGGSAAAIPAPVLASAVAGLLASAGMAVAAARVTARAIVLADVWGISSHGLLRLPSYLRRLEAGGINGRARLREVRRMPSLVAFDGEAGLGHWQLWRGVDVALRISAETGAGVVAIGNSSHCGALGVYAARIRQAGGAGFVLSNGPAAMPANGGTRPVVSTSPLAGAAAADGHGPLVDLALATVTRGQIAKLARSAQPLQPGWAFDAQGRPTTDAMSALAGMVAPIGGAKGYALAYLLEALTGGLIGPSLSVDVVDPFAAERAAEPQGIAHLVVVIRPRAIDVDGQAAGRLARLEELVTRSGGRTPGAGRRLALVGTIAVEPRLRTELLDWATRLGSHATLDVLSGA